MSQITDKELNFYANGYEDTPMRRLARELLALRERAEPFGYYSPEVPTILEQQGYANISRECAGEYRLPLYTTPPAPVAPEYLERLRSLISDPQKLPRRKELISGQQYSYVLLENVEAMVDDACRAAMPPQSGSGWIKCSERMPEKDGNYWAWWSESKRQGPAWFIKSELQAQFQSSEITHWMPLPAAPGKEG